MVRGALRIEALMPICNNGHDVGSARRFCPQCGLALDLEVCPNGHSCPAGSRFCRTCGDKMAEVVIGSATEYTPAEPSPATNRITLPFVAPPSPPSPPTLATRPSSRRVPVPPRVPATPLPPSFVPETEQFVAPSPAPRPVGPGRRRAAWAAGALVVVAALALGAVLEFGHHSRAIGTGSAVAASSTAPQAATVAPAAVSSTALGQAAPEIDTSAVANNQLATVVAGTFQAYFGAINAKDFTAAYAVLSAAQQARVSLAQLMSGSATSTDTDISVQSLQENGDGSVVAALMFTSHQAPSAGPQPGEACTVWSLSYNLVPSPGPVSYLIDSVSAIGSGNQPC